MRALIVGCGYVGQPLAAELVRQEHEVVGICRTEASAEAVRAVGGQAVIGDVVRPDFVRPAGAFDWVVFSAAPVTAASVEEHRALWVEGLGRLLGQFATERPRKFLWISRASVYGHHEGGVVKENSVAKATGEIEKAALEAESRLLGETGKGWASVVLRLAEIYGPERLERMERYIRNETKIAGDGLAHLNLIHRDDAVGVAVAALRNGRPGEIYNGTDDEPVTELHFYSWLAETLGKWRPPFDPAACNRPNYRVSNRRLTMELGYRFKFPNFRHGYTAEIKRLTDAGLLDIQPEPR